MGRASRRKREMRAGAPDPRRKRDKPYVGARGEERPPPAWNGEPCEARRCIVRIAAAEEFADTPKHWALTLAGQERAAVEVVYAGQTFYIDDQGHPEEERNPAAAEFEAERAEEYLKSFGRPMAMPVGYLGWGWAKVTQGRGGPGWGHRSLPVDRVVVYLDDLEREMGAADGTDGDAGQGAAGAA